MFNVNISVNFWFQIFKTTMADEQSTDNLSDSTDSSEGSSSTIGSPPPRTSCRRRGTTRQLDNVTRRLMHGPRYQPKVPRSQKMNILEKLHLRQMFGKIQATSVSEEIKVFSTLPRRLAFFIRDVVPHSALTSGHIFLGFSKCGQFLLSYTQTSTENEQSDLINLN